MGRSGTLRICSDRVGTITFGDGKTKVTITKIDSDGKFVTVYAESPDTITFGSAPKRDKRHVVRHQKS